MIVRQDFREPEELPPKMFLMQIMDNLTKSYCFLWDKKDRSNRVRMTWSDISLYYDKKSFRSSLRKLCAEGLVNYVETKQDIMIELVSWDDIEE